MLSVGATRIPLPMPLGQPLAGYINRAGGAAGIHDDLFVRALVATDGVESICVLGVETLCVDAALVAEVRRRIGAASAIRPEAVLIAATHTHAAPGGVSRFALDPSAEAYLGALDPALRGQVQAALIQAAAQAMINLTPARLVTGTARVEDVARSRIRADGPSDPHVPFVMALDRDGRVLAALFSLACHSTVLGPDNLLYSGDLIGAICRGLEAHWGGESVVVGLAGAAGDISTRFTRRAATFAEVDRLASLAAAAIAGQTVVPAEGCPIGAAREYVPLGLAPAESQASLQSHLAEARRRLDALGGDAPEPARRLVQAEIEGLQVALNAGGPRPAQVQAEVQCLRLGDVLLAGYPGEMFVEYGLATRKALANKHVLIAGYANDYIGYVPTPETSVGYEATVALVAPGSGAKLVEALCRLAANGQG